MSKNHGTIGGRFWFEVPTPAGVGREQNNIGGISADNKRLLIAIQDFGHRDQPGRTTYLTRRQARALICKLTLWLTPKKRKAVRR